MKENPIKIGKYDEKELMEKLATFGQKKEWLEKGMSKGLRKKVLTRLEKQCKIKYMGNGEYYIGSVYDYPIPSNFGKMQKEIYKDLIPLLLMRILESEGHCNFTLGVWAREVDMVNNNYSIVKQNKKEASKVLKTSDKDIDDFYSRADPALDSYVSRALEYLDKAGYIKYQKAHMVRKEYLQDVSLSDSGVVNVDVVRENRIATEQEMEYYAKCIKIADEKLKINEPGHRYYGFKSGPWKNVLNSELKKENIKCVYETHQAYIIHRDKCENLIKLLGGLQFKTYVGRLTKDFINQLVENAGIRFCKADGMFRGYEDIEAYMGMFLDMGNVVISRNPNKSITGKLKAAQQNKNDLKVSINMCYDNDEYTKEVYAQHSVEEK